VLVDCFARRVRRRPLVAFVLITFAWSWTIDVIAFAFFGYATELVSLPRTWGPLVGATVVVAASDRDLRQWFADRTAWNVGLRWYLLALTVPFALNELHTLVAILSGASVSISTTRLLLIAGQLVGVTLLAGGLEEFGWRGFATPRLQARTSTLVAGVTVGLLWVAWHLPLFYAGLTGYDIASLPRYVTWVVPVSVALGYLFTAAERSVLPAMLAHGAINQPRLFETAGKRSLSRSIRPPGG